MQMSNILRRASASFALVAIAAMLSVPAFGSPQCGPRRGDDKMAKHTKPTVVVIKAEWCAACQKLGPTMMELVEQYKERIDFVVLDVTNDQTTTEAAATAEKLGLAKFFEANKKNTSTIAVFGPKNKLLFKTAKNFDRDAYVRAFDDAIAKLS